MEYLLLENLPPVKVDGFMVGFGPHSDEVVIEKGGRKCFHTYAGQWVINNMSAYEQLMRSALYDFMNAARIGNGKREDYVREYGWGMTKQQIDEAWKEYRATTKKFYRLIGHESGSPIAKHFVK